MSSDSGARLTIRNALGAAAQFDMDTGKGLGSGLRLVHSLLPERGARLTFAVDAEGFMVTRLELTCLVVVAAFQKEPALS